MDSTNSINDQINDAVSQIRQSLQGISESFGQSTAYHMVGHAVGLAMLNAVSKQQHDYILRNAITTAAVKATLESNPEEAIKLADKMLSGQDIVSTFTGLKEVMVDIVEIMTKMKGESLVQTSDKDKGDSPDK